jgi:chloramphenicol 3-O-phosphotransferase
MTGQVVVISGTSGSGKTTTTQNFARRAEQCYLMLGLDVLVGTMYPAKYTLFGEKKKEGYYDFHEDPENPGHPLKQDYFGPVGWQTVRALHEMIAAAARSGQNMVIDHLAFVDPPLLQDLVWRLHGIPVLFVGLKPPFEVLEKRVTEREFVLPAPIKEAMGDKSAAAIGEILRQVLPWYYEAAYQNDCFDLVVDTAKFTADEVCEQIEQRLARGPGTAFDTLRARYPRPVGT